MVISKPGLPRRSSCNNGGKIAWLGTGRVWSLAIITAVRLPLASTDATGEPIGSASDCSTKARPGADGQLPLSRDSKTPTKFSVGTANSK